MATVRRQAIIIKAIDDFALITSVEKYRNYQISLTTFFLNYHL